MNTLLRMLANNDIQWSIEYCIGDRNTTTSFIEDIHSRFLDDLIQQLEEPETVKETIDEQTIKQHTKQLRVRTEADCIICLETLQQGAKVIRLNVCNHFMCKDCATQYFDKGNTVCPMCKKVIFNL